MLPVILKIDLIKGKVVILCQKGKTNPIQKITVHAVQQKTFDIFS